ncbi:helix-turn-helix domain-containing protein [Devosia equisanguinis]|uniref:helix-turn-helix domain-containing protein n=1 Tax=Devosia equisanguinis TaxID=2490941 RepID=UPI0019D2CDB6
MRLSPKTLANLRSSGRGPRFVKMGQIRYRHSDLLDFIERASAQSTAEAQNAKQ